MEGNKRYIDRARREREERREEGVSEPLVHPVTKDREGAGIPEITKVKKRSSCTGKYIYKQRGSHDFKIHQWQNESMTKEWRNIMQDQNDE